MKSDVKEINALKAALFGSVGKRLAEFGFEPKLARDGFIRVHDGVADQFQLACKDAKTGYRIQPSVGVRIERVEQIFHQTSGFERKFHDNTSTMGTSVGTLLGGSPRACQFLLDSDSDIPSVTESVVGVFRDTALPYFEQWRLLSRIDAELNDDPAKRTVHRGLAWFRCSTGIIVAKLVGRTNYEQLATFYTDVMRKDNKGFYFERFDSLLRSLEGF